jgi:drug/metabolite transporter (DMT)-like permease
MAVLIGRLLMTAASFCIISAFRNTDVSVVAGYRYSVVLVAMLIGWLVWGETPDKIALAGIALIVGCGLYTLHRQRVPHNSEIQPDCEKLR